MNMLPWCLKEVINTIIASIILYALAISVLKFSTEMTKSLESLSTKMTKSLESQVRR